MSSTRLLDAEAFKETLARLSAAYWRTFIVAPIPDRPALTVFIAVSSAAMAELAFAAVVTELLASPPNKPPAAVPMSNEFDP